jgi:cytosine/adenosine deaminase-related metal-dependent hydrolase
LLRAGTVNGYRCLGWDSGGSIAVGQLADLTTISVDNVRLSGCSTDALLEAAVFAAAATDVTNVIVGGATVVRSGAHTTIDVASELRRSITAVYGAHP